MSGERFVFPASFAQRRLLGKSPQTGGLLPEAAPGRSVGLGACVAVLQENLAGRDRRVDPES